MSPDPSALGPQEKVCIELVGRNWAVLGNLGQISCFGIYESLEICEIYYAKSVDWMISSRRYLARQASGTDGLKAVNQFSPLHLR